MDEAVHWSLPPHAQAVSASREWVRSSCPRVPPQVLDDVLLLASELVTNAVRHGQGEIICRLWPGPGVVRFEVADRSDMLPEEVDRGLVADSGRGLRIVDTLATRWGTVPGQREGGKTVWFEVDTGA